MQVQDATNDEDQHWPAREAKYYNFLTLASLHLQLALKHADSPIAFEDLWDALRFEWSNDEVLVLAFQCIGTDDEAEFCTVMLNIIQGNNDLTNQEASKVVDFFLEYYRSQPWKGEPTSAMVDKENMLTTPASKTASKTKNASTFTDAAETALKKLDLSAETKDSDELAWLIASKNRQAAQQATDKTIYELRRHMDKTISRLEYKVGQKVDQSLQAMDAIASQRSIELNNNLGAWMDYHATNTGKLQCLVRDEQIFATREATAKVAEDLSVKLEDLKGNVGHELTKLRNQQVQFQRQSTEEGRKHLEELKQSLSNPFSTATAPLENNKENSNTFTPTPKLRRKSMRI